MILWLDLMHEFDTQRDELREDVHVIAAEDGSNLATTAIPSSRVAVIRLIPHVGQFVARHVRGEQTHRGPQAGHGGHAGLKHIQPQGQTVHTEAEQLLNTMTTMVQLGSAALTAATLNTMTHAQAPQMHMHERTYSQVQSKVNLNSRRACTVHA